MGQHNSCKTLIGVHEMHQLRRTLGVKVGGGLILEGDVLASTYGTIASTVYSHVYTIPSTLVIGSLWSNISLAFGLAYI